MRKEKISKKQKRAIATLDPSGKIAIDAISDLTDTSPSTVYNAKREGKLLNQIDNLEKSNRKLTVQNTLLKMALSSKEAQKSSGHSY